MRRDQCQVEGNSKVLQKLRREFPIDLQNVAEVDDFDLVKVTVAHRPNEESRFPRFCRWFCRREDFANVVAKNIVLSYSRPNRNKTAI